uniref:VWFA domain-containing protein n=1 Tax=Parastrongyloides trichosuri TaxID=131310 RepID=A0A0N4ZRG6_PARTI
MKYYIFVDLNIFNGDENVSIFVDSVNKLISGLETCKHETEQINMSNIEVGLHKYLDDLRYNCEFNLIEAIFILSSKSKYFDEIDIKKCLFPSFFIFHDKDGSNELLKNKTKDILFLWEKKYLIKNHKLSIQVSESIDEFVKNMNNIEKFLCQTEDMFLAGHPDFSIWFQCIPKIPSYISSVLWGVTESINHRYIKSCFDDPIIQEKKIKIEEDESSNVDKEIKIESQGNCLTEIKDVLLSPRKDVDLFFWKVPKPKEEHIETSDTIINNYKPQEYNISRSKRTNKWDVKNISTVKTKLDNIYEEKQGEIIKVKEHFIQLHNKGSFRLYNTSNDCDNHVTELNGLISHHLEIISFAPVNQILGFKVFQPRFELKCKKLINESQNNKDITNQTYFDSLGETLFTKKTILYFKHIASGEYGFIQATKDLNDEIKLFLSFFDYNNKKFVLNRKIIDHSINETSNHIKWGMSNVPTHERQCWLTISSYRNECNKIFRSLLNPEKLQKLEGYIKSMKRHADIIGVTEEYNCFLKAMVASALPENPGDLAPNHYALLKNIAKEGIYYYP